MVLRLEIFEEADFILLQGGEMPEVALHESLYSLERLGIDPDPDEKRRLEGAVLERYRVIVRRDLDLRNRCFSHFRGPARARVNVGRLLRFAAGRDLNASPAVSEARTMLSEYLATEAMEIESGRAWNTVGLNRVELTAFLSELGAYDPETLRLAEKVATVRTLAFKEAVAACRSIIEGRPRP